MLQVQVQLEVHLDMYGSMEAPDMWLKGAEGGWWVWWEEV